MLLRGVMEPQCCGRLFYLLKDFYRQEQELQRWRMVSTLLCKLHIESISKCLVYLWYASSMPLGVGVTSTRRNSCMDPKSFLENQLER